MKVFQIRQSIAPFDQWTVVKKLRKTYIVFWCIIQLQHENYYTFPTFFRVLVVAQGLKYNSEGAFHFVSMHLGLV